MKKNILTLMALTLIAVFAISSCKKDEEPATTSDMTHATIKGVVYADLDETNDTNTVDPIKDYEFAPVGTKVILVVNSKDLVANPIAGKTYADITYETEVGANGVYTVTVDATAKTANYTVKADDFTYAKKTGTSTTKTTVYQATDQYVSVVKDITKIVDIKY